MKIRLNNQWLWPNQQQNDHLLTLLQFNPYNNKLPKLKKKIAHSSSLKRKMKMEKKNRKSHRNKKKSNHTIISTLYLLKPFMS